MKIEDIVQPSDLRNKTRAFLMNLQHVRVHKMVLGLPNDGWPNPVGRIIIVHDGNSDEKSSL